MNIKEFLKGTPETPRLLRADAYTIGSIHVSPDEKEAAVFHVVPRKGLDKILPFAKDSRLIFAGLRRILRDLFTKPVTVEEIEEADRFLSTAHAGGTKYRFDRDLWVRVVKENNGVIPIKIEAFREGTVAFPYEPIMQITAECGYGMLAVWFESKLLQVWSVMERVTILRWWADYLMDRAFKFNVPPKSGDSSPTTFKTFAGYEDNKDSDYPTTSLWNEINFFMHDFGDRASSCAQESEILGEAHLYVFPGTDTFAGAYQYWKNNGEKPRGCSIHALAHHSVTGFRREQECHEALYELGKETGITAHVADTYDFKQTTEKLAGNLVTEYEDYGPDDEGNYETFELGGDWELDKNIVVLRPDSGDPVECIRFILHTCERYEIFTVVNGWKCATRLRWIQGDSMNFETMIKIMDMCEEMGWNPFRSGAFGVGGALRNNLARDHIGLSMKLAAVGKDFRPVVKRSETTAKTSIPGIVDVMYDCCGERSENAGHNPTVYPRKDSIFCYGEGYSLKIWYDGTTGNLETAFLNPCLEDNDTIQERIRNRFMDRVQPEDVLSDEIKKIREEVLNNGGW